MITLSLQLMVRLERFKLSEVRGIKTRELCVFEEEGA